MPAPFYTSRFRIVTTGQWTFDLTISDIGTVNNIQIPLGTYYIDSPTAAESFTEIVRVAMATAFPTRTFTKSWSTTTGMVTFNCTNLGGGNTWSANFDQDGIAGALGFGNAGGGWLLQSGAVTGSSPCQYCIFAADGRSEYRRRRKFSSVSYESDSGVGVGIGSSGVRRWIDWVHDFEPDEFVASPFQSGKWDEDEDVIPWTWEDFVYHHAQYGQPFRFYSEAGAAISAYEDEYQLRQECVDMFEEDRTEDPSSSRYNRVRLAVRRFRAASAP